METLLSCRAASVRGELKHTYLTNKVCLKTLPEDLLESMLYKEDGIPQHEVIRKKIGELIELMDSPEHGFSPAQLVDRLQSFRDFPNEERLSAKHSVHQNFVAQFELAKRKSQVEALAGEFLGVLAAFVASPVSVVKSAKAQMECVQASARGLIRELESLPKGIWLWKTTAGKTTRS
jgi:hypothetical protein